MVFFAWLLSGNSSKAYASMDDKALLDVYRAKGELVIIGVLFERYLHLVYGVCLKYLKDEDEAQDAVMQIFEDLIEKLMDHEVSYLSSWLHQVSRNHCLMLLRSPVHKRTERGSDYVFENHSEDMENKPEMHPKEKEERRANRLHESLAVLEEKQKTCIELMYLQHKSYQEISEITGYTFKQVKSYIQNGKRNLKKQLGDLPWEA